MTEVNKTPSVSVCMITYNHVPYITQAIDGVLMQETSFPVELVIGDDCSTDGTTEICYNYLRLNPDRIRLVVHRNNVGLSENFRITLNSCTGKYIAICEGDDYWTCRDKLQKQVAFLEENPNYSMSFHNSETVYENNPEKNHLSTGPQSTDYVFNDFINRKFVVGTQSMVFRRDAVPILPDGFIVFDWVLFLLISSSGPTRFDSEVFSVYRKHTENWTNDYNSKKARFFLEMTLQCKEYFKPHHQLTFDKWIGHYYADICFGSFVENDIDGFLEAFKKCKEHWPEFSVRKKLALKIRKFAVSMPLLAKYYNRLLGKVGTSK